VGQWVLTGLVTVFILRQVGLTGSAVAELEPARWPVTSWAHFGLSLVLLAGGYLVSGALWGRMVEELGGARLAPATAAGVYFLANLGRYVPGKVWQLVGLAALARRHGVAPTVAAGAAVLGQITALAGAAVMGGLAFLTNPDPTRTALAAAWLVGVVVLLAVPPIFRRLVAAAARAARTEVPETLEGDPWFGARWVALYALNWAIYGLAFWALAAGFGLPGGVLESASGFAAAYLLGYLAIFAPAGIGIREGFLVVFLDPIMGARSLGIAVIARLWTTLMEIALALALAGRARAPTERS
jgi:hypothetical protein